MQPLQIQKEYMNLNMQSIIDLLDNEKKEDFSDGDLILVITCRKCDAMFEINAQSIAIAMMTNASIWEYIKYVQHSKCRVCNKD